VDARSAGRPLLTAVLAAAVWIQTPHGLTLQQRSPSRAAVILSDLHMGMGRDGSGTWHPLEDFRWADEFVAFLKAVDRENKSAIDLILNGDTFELQQSMEPDCVYPDPDLGCDEPGALARLNRVLAAHTAEIGALAAFVRSGSNRVVFVPGDHDAAMLFPSVARRVIQALAAPSGRVEVAASGYWRSADGQIHAEHGHQIGINANRFDRWPSPFVSRSGREHLARPWGEQLVQNLINRYEAQYPIVDNVAHVGGGLKYALSAEGAADAGPDAARLLKFFLFIISWQQFRLDLDGGDAVPPEWDLAKVRSQGPPFLVGTVPDDDRFKPLASKALADGRLAKALDELSDEELVTLCDYRAAVRRARRRMERVLTQLPGQGPVVTECPRTPETRGSTFEYFWRSRDLAFARHLDALARGESLPGPIEALVYGHSHLADRSQAGINAINGDYPIAPEGFSPVRQAIRPIAINGGAWQRTITPVQLDQLKVDRAVSDRDLLIALQPEQLPPCYSFVQIDPYRSAPDPRIRYWRVAGSGSWEFAPSCGR
jgi:hypothetical protein